MTDHICENCGNRYYRRNLVEAWTEQNPGHRTGWRKEKLRICTSCQPAPMTRQSLIMVQAKVISRKKPDIRIAK